MESKGLKSMKSNAPPCAVSLLSVQLLIIQEHSGHFGLKKEIKSSPKLLHNLALRPSNGPKFAPIGPKTTPKGRHQYCLVGHLFPISSKQHGMRTRHSDVFQINKCYSKRYLKSAIPAMQRILNRDKQKQIEALKQISKSVLSPTNFACQQDLLLRH